MIIPAVGYSDPTLDGPYVCGQTVDRFAHYARTVTAGARSRPDKYQMAKAGIKPPISSSRITATCYDPARSRHR